MSISSQPIVPPAPAPDAPGKPREIAVFHHSNLFYWWPVWLLGFVLAGVTYYEDHYLAIVPRGTMAASEKQKVTLEDGTKDDRAILILPPGESNRTQKDPWDGEVKIDQPHVRISVHKGLGTVFFGVLLLVIIITNVTLRGLWSVLVILVIIMLTVILYLSGWWDILLLRVQLLAIHINMSGYLVLSIALFAAWIINFLFFDRQTYMIFAPGQVRARLTIGGGETVYGTTGIVVQKQRGDLFRHWILGFGSGDLIVRPAGVHSAIEMPNVLNVGRVVKQIEQLIKEQVVVRKDH